MPKRQPKKWIAGKLEHDKMKLGDVIVDAEGNELKGAVVLNGGFAYRHKSTNKLCIRKFDFLTDDVQEVCMDDKEGDIVGKFINKTSSKKS